MNYSYKTKKTCSSKIDFELNDGIVTNIKFTGGCPGNLNAIEKLLEGAKASYIIETLEGNTCGFRPTSCTDQLVKAVEEALEKQNDSAS